MKGAIYSSSAVNIDLGTFEMIAVTPYPYSVLVWHYVLISFLLLLL